MKRKEILPVLQPLIKVVLFWFSFSLISSGGFLADELATCFYSHNLLYISFIGLTPISFASTCLLRINIASDSFSSLLSFIWDKNSILQFVPNSLIWTLWTFDLLHLFSRVRKPANPKLRATHQLKPNSDSLIDISFIGWGPKFWY